MKSSIISVFAAAVYLLPIARAEDGVVVFSGRTFKLAFVEVAKNGSVVNEYVPTGDATSIVKKRGSDYDEWRKLRRPIIREKKN